MSKSLYHVLSPVFKQAVQCLFVNFVQVKWDENNQINAEKICPSEVSTTASRAHMNRLRGKINYWTFVAN